VRIVVISDTHLLEGSVKLPDKLLEDIKNSDMLIHAGDFIELKVFEGLKAIAKDIKAVWGNMDCEDLKKKLPEKEVFKAGKYKVGVMHGSGASGDMVQGLSAVFKNDDLDLVVFGHSHSAFNKKRGAILFFNPGSPTDRVFSKYNSYGIIEIADKIKARIVRL